MFVNNTHLPNLLTPDHYTSPEHLEQEIQRLFKPGWHCIAALPDLPQDGDYVTYELFEVPLITWRTGGEVHTFLNVCPHRFSILRDKPCGHIGSLLRCQYHGWEFDATGNTRKIPDARSFKPMKQGELGLTKYRTETVGQLIFVTMNDDAPSLAEFLGPIYEMCEGWFADDCRMILSEDVVHNANWKVVAENTLEGYHTEEVHATSFGKYPDEEHCVHEFQDVWDIYTYDYSHHRQKREKLVHWLAGLKPTYTYKHLLRYPNLVFSEMSLLTWVVTYVPISPTQVREVTRVFCYPGKTNGLRSALLFGLLRFWGRKLLLQVRAEDSAIYPSVQRGISAPVRPHKSGLVSAREERIFPFQKYLLKTLSNGSDVPKAKKNTVRVSG